MFVGRVCPTHTITEIGVTEPRVEMLYVAGGRLKLHLTEYPILLEPRPEGVNR